MKSKNKIICAKWGTLYDDGYVDELYKKVKKNCSVDFDFECFTEFDETWEAYKLKHYRASTDPPHQKKPARCRIPEKRNVSQHRHVE